MEQESLVPLKQGFVPYVFELAAEDPADGVALAICLVVLKRENGFMLALPVGYLQDDILDPASEVTLDDVIGPARVVRVPAGTLEGDAVVPAPDTTVAVVLLDVSSEAADRLKPYQTGVEDDVIHFYANDHIDIFPLVDPLVAEAYNWVLAPTASERIVYYSAEEEAEEAFPEQQEADTTPARLLRPKARAGPGTGGDGSTAKAVEKKKAKPTVASVAAALEDIAKVLPTLTSRVAELDSRTSGLVGVPSQAAAVGGPTTQPSLSSAAQTVPERVSALRKPLSAAIPISGQVLPAGALLSKMPPPRPCSHKAVVESANTARLEAQELTLERQLEDPNANMDLARAVLAQSNALTALVGQLAQGGDSMADLSTSWTSGLSTKGAVGRARLQQELSQHKGVFFNSVIQAMARRMHPSSPVDLEPLQLMERGVFPSAYMERFGGYGRVRDIGQIAWQVALIMDHLQQENLKAAQDATALLSVCLEQTALDSGKMDVGLLLALTEDPPSSVFTNRTLAASSRARAFAPTADQRWITTALSYLRELDLIMSRRNEFAGGDRAPKKEGGLDPDRTPKPRPKKKPKGGWKKSAPEAEEGE